MQKSKLIGAIVVLSIVVAVVSFYGGMQYQVGKQGALFGSAQFGGGVQSYRTGGSRNGGTGGMRNGFRPVNGEIISVDAKSIVVKSQDGSSKIVLLSDKTNINKAEKALVSDLVIGETIAVFGTTNTDGSVSAQNIQLNPQTQFSGRQ